MAYLDNETIDNMGMGTAKFDKPPLGLVPKIYHQRKRCNTICEAMRRYLDAELVIPIEWVEERNELILILRKNNFIE